MWPNGEMGFSVSNWQRKPTLGNIAANLTAREAATLAAVLPNPRRYKPNGTSRYVEGQSERIYQIMVRRGIVIQEYDDVIEAKD